MSEEPVCPKCNEYDHSCKCKKGDKMRASMTKLTRRRNPESKQFPMIATGDTGFGEFGVMKSQEAMLKIAGLKGLEDPGSISPNNPEYYDYPEELSARIDQCLMVGRPGSDNWLRTSAVRSYYIHETDGSHPDKLVLPKDFPIEDAADLPFEILEVGDMLVATQNSIYLVRKQG